MKKFLIILIILLTIIIFVLIGVKGIVEEMDFLDELDSMGEDFSPYNDYDYSDIANNSTDDLNTTNNNSNNTGDTSPPINGEIQTIKIPQGAAVGFNGLEGTHYETKDMSANLDEIYYSEEKEEYCSNWRIDDGENFIDSYEGVCAGEDLGEVIDYTDDSIPILEIYEDSETGKKYVVIERV